MAAVLDRSALLDEEWFQQADHAEVVRQITEWVDRADLRRLEALALRLPERWPEDPLMRHYARVFAPSVARISARPMRPNRDSEREWLAAHRHEHPGCWIALDGDQLVLAHPDLKRVRAAVRATVPDGDALLVFQPGPEAWG
jgi:hypothetical protein